jgi:hypothetical protein
MPLVGKFAWTVPVLINDMLLASVPFSSPGALIKQVELQNSFFCRSTYLINQPKQPLVGRKIVDFV